MLSLLGVLALNAIAASAASASPEWWVAGKLLLGTAALAENTNVTKPLRMETSTVTFECKKVKIKTGLIQSPDKRDEKAEVFEECVVISAPKCSIATTETKPLRATLETVGETIKLKFEPQTGTEIATVDIRGAECSLAGEYLFSGTMVCNYPEVESESTEHPLEFTPLSGSKVKLNAPPALFSGTDKVLLAFGSKWSAR
jgi:hypothetical protein